MKTDNSMLFEKSGIWFFQGNRLEIGGRVQIHGIDWKVLGVGRARSESQAPFLWIRNDWYGTTVYAPAMNEHQQRMKMYSKTQLAGTSLAMTAPRLVRNGSGTVIATKDAMTAA